MRGEDILGVVLVVMVMAVLPILGFMAFSESDAVYVSPARAANTRCARYGGVKTLTQPAHGDGTVVCADGIARPYDTRIK